MKTALRLTTSLVALSTLLGALAIPAASAAPLNVESIIAAEQANDDVILAANKKGAKDGKWLDRNDSNDDNGNDDNGGDDNDGEGGNDGDGEGSEGSEGSEGGEGDGEGSDGGDNN